jgi:hypothetical protein
MNETVEVECYSGYTYAQEPRAIVWHGQRYEVKRIVKRWRTPQGPHFRVEVAGISNLPWPTRQPALPAPCRDGAPVGAAQVARASPGPVSVPGRGGPGGRQSPISRLVDLTYLEIEDKWTMAVPKLIQEDQG